MSTDSLKTIRWPELLGVAAVVVSVLLLALEIQQNTVVASAQAMAELNALANDMLSSEAQNQTLAELLEKGDGDLNALSRAEARQYHAHVYALINVIDAAYGFYQRGILDEDDFSGWRAYACAYLGGSSVNTLWNAEKETFGVDFVKFVADSCGL
ncbi:MAG TPA: hypothetical protein VFZ51_05870 [Woeseiaceae bacterium]